MADPNNYMIASPQAAFERSYLFGQQIAAQQQAQREAQLKQQQALQAQQAMRMVYDNPTPENISRFYMAYPAYKEQFEAARKPLDEAAAADDLDFTARTLSLLSNGKNDDAISLMDQRATSFGNTRGMEKQAEAAKAIVQTAKTDPKAARQLFALKLAAANPKLYETVFGGAGMTSFQKDLAAAGIDPEGPEGKAKAAEYVALKTDPIVEMDTPDGGRFVGRQSDYYTRYGGGQQGATATPKPLPRIGEVRNGYVFTGGDPANKDNWAKADKMQNTPAPQVGDNGMPTELTRAQYDAVVQAKGKAQTDAWMQRNNIKVIGG